MGTNVYKDSNIFNQTDFDEIKKRLDKLDANSPRLWGKMQVNEMLEYSCLQLKLALGEMEGIKNEGSFLLRTSFGRWLGLYGPNWKKGTNTPAQMNIVAQHIKAATFNVEKATLLNYLENFRNKSDFNQHPFFGKLHKKDWGRLVWKHLDHHLRQFGE
jgi:hypothetical protein